MLDSLTPIGNNKNLYIQCEKDCLQIVILGPTLSLMYVLIQDSLYMSDISNFYLSLSCTHFA